MDLITRLLRYSAGTCLFLTAIHPLHAQQKLQTGHDSAYYETYPMNLYGRLYVSQKYTGFALKGNSDASHLRYHSNSDLKIGAGITYRRISVNVSYGFGFMNTDVEKGKTRDIDLQARLYARKWAFDLFGQLYEGFYLYPKGKGAVAPAEYYTRPDIKFLTAGASVYRILNHRRFSLRPAFVQDERQKKSAGSLLVGGEALYAQVKADSAFVPSVFSSLYDPRQIHALRVLKVGVGAGYAYTQVFPYNLYLTGSLTGNSNLNFVKETGADGNSDKVTVNIDLIYRLGAGYNNGDWSISAFWLSTHIPVKGDPVGNPYVIRTGIYRVLFTKRLNQGSFTRKLLWPIDTFKKIIRQD